MFIYYLGSSTSGSSASLSDFSDMESDTPVQDTTLVSPMDGDASVPGPSTSFHIKEVLGDDPSASVKLGPPINA